MEKRVQSARPARALDASFFVVVSGQIEKADFGSLEDIYCRYSYFFGPDWMIKTGIQTGISQTSRKSTSNIEDGIVWNFPIDVTFKSTNVFGWPRIALNVYGMDFFGRDVVRGYGSALIPPIAGMHEIDVETYVPMGSSMLNNLISWLMGNPPEFFDSTLVCKGEGREVTRVQSTGYVRLKINVVTKGMQAVGYSVVDQTPPHTEML
eukprot:gene2148-4179_t